MKRIQPSLIASVLTFVIFGLHSVASTVLPHEGRGFLFAILTLNACFFFYYEAYAESDPAMVRALAKQGPLESWLRVLAQTQLFLLWLWLDNGWNHFLFALVVLYVTYVLWDLLVWRAFTKHHLAWLDLFGLLLGVALFWIHAALSLHEPLSEKPYLIALGVVGTLFLIQTLAGVYVGSTVLRFNPFVSIPERKARSSTPTITDTSGATARPRIATAELETPAPSDEEAEDEPDALANDAELLQAPPDRKR